MTRNTAITWARYFWLLFLAVYMFIGDSEWYTGILVISFVALLPFRYSRWKISVGILDIAVACFSAYICIRCVGARNEVAGWDRCCAVLLGLNTYLLIRWYGGGILRCLKADRLLPFLMSALFAVFAVCFVMHFKGALGAGFSDLYHLRHLLRPGGWLINAWSTLLLLLIPIVLIRNRNVFVFSLLTGVALLLTFSRSAYICLALMAAILACSLMRHRVIKKFLTGIGCAALLVAALFPREVVTTIPFSGNESQARSVEWRLKTIEETVDLVKKEPWIGYGVSRYSEVAESAGGFDTRRAFTTTAPNIAISLLLESGIVGFGLLVIVTIVGIVVWLSEKQRSAVRWFCVAGIVVFIAKEMTQSFSANFSLLLIGFFILLAIPRQKSVVRINGVWLLMGLLTVELTTALFVRFSSAEYSYVCDEDPYCQYLKERRLEKAGNNGAACVVYRKLCSDFPDNALFLYREAVVEYLSDCREEALSLLIRAIDRYPRLLCLDEFQKLLKEDTVLNERIKAEYSVRNVSADADPMLLAAHGFVCRYFGIGQWKVYLNRALEKLPNLSIPWYLLGDTAKFDFLSVGYSTGVVTDRESYSPLRTLSEADLIEQLHRHQATIWYGENYADNLIEMAETL